jgi:hypothetical protein
MPTSLWGGDFSEPYVVPPGSGADADTQFIVFDSSLVGVQRRPANDPMHVKYRALERAFALGARRPNTFFMNHRPILAFAPNPATPDVPYPGNGALQSVLELLQPTVLFPPNVQAILAGHVHLFEVVSFSTPQPAQFRGEVSAWLATDEYWPRAASNWFSVPPVAATRPCRRPRAPSSAVRPRHCRGRCLSTARRVARARREVAGLPRF